jgi:Big-like domain-containing protein
MHKGPYLAAVLVVSSTGLADAACAVSRWSFYWGQESTAAMTTDGAPCTTSIGRTAGTTEVQSIAISSRPRNGTASASGISVNYRPKAGFKGEDSFAFTITGRRLTTPEKATVRVSVSVR